MVKRIAASAMLAGARNKCRVKILKVIAASKVSASGTRRLLNSISAAEISKILTIGKKYPDFPMAISNAPASGLGAGVGIK